MAATSESVDGVGDYDVIVDQLKKRYHSSSRDTVRSSQKGDWVIIEVHFDDDNKDYFDYYLFHIPSYRADNCEGQPLKHVGRRENDTSGHCRSGGVEYRGSGLKFGEGVDELVVFAIKGASSSGCGAISEVIERLALSDLLDQHYLAILEQHRM